MEKTLTSAVHSAIFEAVKAKIAGYNSPLDPMINAVVEKRGDLIRTLVDDAFTDALSGQLREGLRTALAHKLAKILVSKMEGEIEKRVNDLRSNPTTRATITLAVENAIKSL